jgi:hypothetical protein
MDAIDQLILNSQRTVTIIDHSPEVGVQFCGDPTDEQLAVIERILSIPGFWNIFGKDRHNLMISCPSGYNSKDVAIALAKSLKPVSFNVCCQQEIPYKGLVPLEFN